MAFSVGLVDPGGNIVSTNGVISSSVNFNANSSCEFDNYLNVIKESEPCISLGNSFQRWATENIRFPYCAAPG